MKKSNLVIFLGGFGLFLVVSAFVMIGATIWLDLHNVSNYSLGQGLLSIYNFEKSEEGFSIGVNLGLFLAAAGFGLLSLALKDVFKRIIVIR